MNEDVLTGGRLHLSRPAALDLPPSSHFHKKIASQPDFFLIFQLWVFNAKKLQTQFLDISYFNISKKNCRLFAPVSPSCKS